MTRRIKLVLLGTAFFVGCGSQRVPVGDGESDSSGSQTGGATETGNGPGSPSATSGDSASNTSSPSGVTGSPTSGSTTLMTATASTTSDLESSSGSLCEKSDCAQCPPPLVNAEYCIGGEFICACELQRPCEVMEVACAYLELDPSAKENAVDCGIATLDDPLSVWEAVTSCVQDSEVNEIAFKGAFELPSAGTPLFTGFIGLTGAVYQVKELFADTPGLGNRVEIRDCSGLLPFACPLEVGEVCVQCDSPGEFTNVCQENPE